jgi:hypothetical protein
MTARRRPARDEERYWRMRTILELGRVAFEIFLDVLRRGGGPLF